MALFIGNATEDEGVLTVPIQLTCSGLEGIDLPYFGHGGNRAFGSHPPPRYTAHRISLLLQGVSTLCV